MQSLNISQFVINGSAPLSYASQHVVRHMFDMNVLEESSMNDRFELSIYKSALCPLTFDVLTTLNDFSQQQLTSDSTVQTILADSSFSNKNMTMLLRSALTSGTASFRLALHDFKMINKKIFSQEINQPDKHQNTLLWYLTKAGLYNSIEELHRLALIELNINIKNGQLGQTILHYAVIHGNIEEIRIVLNIGVDTNLCDRYGRTAFHYIALCGTRHKNDDEIIQLLIDHGALSNLEDNMCQTSLHFAIIKENYDLAEYLIILPNINVCIRNKHGYTSLNYLCKHILDIPDSSLETKQCEDNLERIFNIISLIVDHCPFDELSSNFHMKNNDKLGENLLLHVYNKLSNLPIPLYINTLFHRLESIIIGTDQDHRLFAEQLLKLHSWKSAIVTLRNTHNVNISNALIQYIARDPHLLLTNHNSSDLSMSFVLIFYALASNMTLLTNIVPMCEFIIKPKSSDTQKNEQKIKQSITTCDLYITNNNLHATYVTFIHTCLHYASFNVFSLKHLCRYYIRRYFKSHISNKIEKCSYLNLKQCDYIKFNELSVIYSKMHDLSFIIYLIKRLYNIHQIEEYNLFENEIINDNLKSSLQFPMEKFDISTQPSSEDTVSYNDLVQNLSNRSDTTEIGYETRIEDVKPVRQRTIEEIMAGSEISSHSLSDPTESKHSSQTSMIDINLSLETNQKSTLSFSNDEISTEQFENELADVKTKSKNIEEMIEKFLLKE